MKKQQIKREELRIKSILVQMRHSGRLIAFGLARQQLHACLIQLPETLTIASSAVMMHPAHFSIPTPPEKMPQPRWTTSDLLDLEFLLQQDEGEDMALLSGALYRNFGPSFVFYYFLFAAALLVVIFIDLHHQIIPDKISLPGIVIGGGILYAVAAGYVLLTGKEGMGGGDIKLLAMIGAFLGWQSLLYVVFASSLTGSVIGGLSLLLQKKDSQTRIPFGPFFSLAALSWLFFQDSILAVWQWYLGAAHF